jgi:nicotinamide-nucleotide amidase
MQQTLKNLAAELSRRNLMLVTIESCTGGGVAERVTSIPGSSAWFDRAWVTYSNAAKTEMVSVEPSVIESHGAVSEQVARAMVEGALAKCQENRLAVALTGVAGPDGGSEEKPVGTVYIAWSLGNGVRVELCHFSGDRGQIREAAIDRALSGIFELIQ